MKLTGNTIFITGGGSGIGRGLAEALHQKGNQVIIAGRRKSLLKQVATENPGIDYLELDIQDPQSIAAAAASLKAKYPKLNVLINNAGIAQFDGADGAIDDAKVTSMVTTNLLGPIRLTSALIEHLKAQPEAYIVNVTSGLAFIPLASAATYSSTKAALHSFSLSQRYLLRNTNVRVVEIAPPYVQTELGGPQQATDPRAMPLRAFIDETMNALGSGANEALTEQVASLRGAVGPNDAEATLRLNDTFASPQV